MLMSNLRDLDFFSFLKQFNVCLLEFNYLVKKTLVFDMDETLVKI